MADKHEWIEVGARRWCPDCGSYQTKQGGHWRDSMTGPYPAYRRTDLTAHGTPGWQSELFGQRNHAPEETLMSTDPNKPQDPGQPKPQDPNRPGR